MNTMGIHLLTLRPCEGSTDSCAGREMIEVLRRYARGEGFDEPALLGLDSEALDFRASSESSHPSAHASASPDVNRAYQFHKSFQASRIYG